MLIAHKLKDGRVRYSSKPLLIKTKDVYQPPPIDFKTTTSVWMINELIKRRVQDWRRITGEDGHQGLRSVLRKDSVFTGTYSVFPIPLVEYILTRYAGEKGNKVLDPFAGGPPRAIAASLMGYEYHGVEIRKEQIDENNAALSNLALTGIHYHHDDGRFLDIPVSDFDFIIACPPYYSLEVYSDHPADISNFPNYETFNAAMQMSAWAQFDKLKPGKFAAIVIGNIRDKNKEVIDLRGHTVENYKDAGFLFHDEAILCRNIGSAAKRSTNMWKGQKLVRIHEYLLIFKKPEA